MNYEIANQTPNFERYRTLKQEEAHQNTSERYSMIPTSRVLTVLADHGWMPAKVQEARTRLDENRGFQKHVVRLRNERFGTNFAAVGDSLPEIVLINSHMGSASFQLMCGIFRLVCSNGMIAGDTWNQYRVRHVGYTDSAVEAAITGIVEHIPLVADSMGKFKAIELNPEEQTAYAKAAIELRFDNDKWAVEPNQLLRPRRWNDKATPDLWSTLNVVQENLIKGTRVTDSQGRRRNARAVNSIDKDTSINRALWVMAQELAKYKEQAAA